MTEKREEGGAVKALTEKRDALLRRREKLLTEWVRNEAAL